MDLRLRNGRLALIAAGAIAVAAAQTPSADIPAKVTPERVLAGSAIFNGRSCVLCHAPGGRGEGASAPDLADVEWLHGAGDFDGIQRAIVWGVEADEMRVPRRFEMFPRGGVNLSDEEVDAVTAYVWSLSRPQSSAFVTAQGRFIDLVRAGNGADAVALFRAQAAQPLLPERGLNRLGHAVLAGQPRAALAVFQLSAGLNPESGPAHMGLGDAHRALGDRTRAAESYRRALAISPDNEAVQQKLRELEQ
jgi:mono/diheme cytochrome c family protein